MVLEDCDKAPGLANVSTDLQLCLDHYFPKDVELYYFVCQNIFFLVTNYSLWFPTISNKYLILKEPIMLKMVCIPT